MRYLPVLAMTALMPVSANTQWTAVTSPNFELITTASSSDGRRAAEYFEQVRDFFTRVRSHNIDNHLPVTIILFRNLKEFKPYTVNEGAAAYFVGDQSHDFIVMSGFAEQNKATAVHEYMHLLIRHMELGLPIWLNEGIAEVYSTLRPLAGKVAVGNVPEGRGYVLGREQWLTLPHLFSVNRDSPEYNEKSRMGILYSQSWLLTHMLMLDPRYSGKFGEFLGQISTGATSEQVFEQVYGKSVLDLQKDLRAYYQARSLRGVLFDTKLEKLKVGDPRPADSYDVELTLARLTSMLDRKEEATARLEKLAKDNPARWEPMEALGQLSWRKGDMEGARAWMRKAVDLKPDNWNVYWDYARLAAQSDSDRPSVIASLRRILELNPTYVDAKLMLAEQLYHEKRYGDSWATYITIQKVDSDRAARLFLGKAHALLGLEDYVKSRAAAEQALKYAKEPNEKESAQSILTFLDRREEFARQSIAVKPTMNAVAPLELPRVPSTSADSKPIRATVTGVLQEVQCKGEQARIVLQAGQRQIGFMIMSPERVNIRNAPGTTINLTCGKQSPGTKVLIEFDETPDSAQASLGEVRGLDFLR
jgi:tetratricopeptide (TPR) repeat protein